MISDIDKVVALMPRETFPFVIAARRLGRVPPTGYLVVTCWCETSYVYVAQEKVKDGRTESCGAPGCHA